MKKSKLTKSITSQAGFIKMVLLIVVIVIVGFVAISVYVQSASNDMLETAKTFHKDMRTKSANDVYQGLCPEFREKTSISQFSEAQSKYKSLSAIELEASPRSTNLNSDVLEEGAEKDAKARGSVVNSWAAMVYGTGNLNVGIAFINDNGSSCVHSFALESL